MALISLVFVIVSLVYRSRTASCFDVVNCLLVFSSFMKTWSFGAPSHVFLHRRMNEIEGFRMCSLVSTTTIHDSDNHDTKQV